MGQYTQALKSYQQALNILRDIHDLAGEGGVLANIGLVYQNLGQHERALESYEQALSIAQTIGNRSGEGVILFNIGWVYYNLERYAQALERYQQALVILQDIGDRAGEGRVFNNIGSVYHTRGQYEQALASFQYALASAQAIGDQAGEGVARNNIAEVYDGLAQYEQARKSYEYARIILHNIGMRIGEGIVLANIGSLYENQHDVDRAILYYQRSITITELIQGDISIAELKSSFVSGQSDIYARLINLLWTVDQPEKAFEYAERARARSFLNQMGNQRVDFRQDAAPELIQEERGLRLRIITLQNDLALDRNDPEQQDQELTDKLSSNLEQARKQYEQLLVRLKLANPEYASLISVGTLSLEEIQHKVLGSQTTLVEYFVMDDHTLAWVIDQEGFKVIDLAITRDELTGQIEFLRNLVNIKSFDPGASANLYNTLIAPLVPYIHHANLIIVPHGVLHYLPFAALWNAKNERYLIEDYTITYAPSASVLKFILEKRTPNDGRLLVMGNPNGSLPSAEEEARTVAKLYNMEPLVGEQATESEIYSYTGKIDVLHLAVHGYPDPFNPLFTRIELSADNENDGNLEVHEIFGLDLTGTNLVVLSACETALGEQSNGDELVGLTRAFLYAGAPSVVTSLWKIEDEASASLMTDFHHYLGTGMTTAEALRSAQVKILQEEQWRSPYYWAAFSLYGDYLGHTE